jgi:serine/threonine-protein kinase
VLHQVLTRDPPPASQANPACPPAIDPVLARALAKDRAARWPDAAAFSAALQAALAGVDEADADATVTTIVPAIRQHEPPTGLGREDAGLDDADPSLAELLGECLADGVTEKRLAAAAALVEIFGASPDGADRLRRAAEPAMAALAERILTGYPAPGGEGPPPRADWRAAVRLFALLQAGSADGFPETTARIAGQLVAACYAYSPRLNALLFTEAEPDVARISMDLLRLDLVQLALEDLGAEADARKACQALRGFSGQVLGKANALIGGYLASRDSLARFSVANLLVSVEDLIGIAERLFEYGEDETADAADAVGQAVIADFAEKAAGLVELVAEEAMAELADPPASAAGFANRLDQVGFIYLFATRLRHPHCREAMSGLVRRAQAALRRLGDAASAALTDALAVPRERLAEAGPESARVRAAFGRISALISQAERLGWEDLRSRLMADLRSRLTADPAIARLAASGG